MLASIRRWGNSAGVRIPTQILRAVNLGVDSQVDVREENGVIVIRPAVNLYEVGTLVAAITPANRHGEIALGAPVGQESL